MIYEKASNIDVKRINRNRIFRLIYNNEKISKQDIAYRLGMSLPTVTQNLKILKEQGLIEEDGVLESTGGRKAKAISCIKNARFAVGLNITKNHISIVLINLNGDIVKKARISKSFKNEKEYFKEIGTLVTSFTNKYETYKSKILGVGIAVPGILSEDKQTIVYSHVLGLVKEKCENFGEFIPYPYILCNDANAAGIAEMWDVEALKNVVYLFLSSSVRGSIILNNKLYVGENQRSGEVGHMTIVPNGRSCYCGKKGCVDSYCTSNVLSTSANGNLNDFFKLLEQGSKKHEKIWSEYLEYLTITINNLRMLFDCDVILGGDVGAYMDKYIYHLKSLLSMRNTFEADGEYLKICKYKIEATAVGAAMIHIKNFINTI
ncbi:transcriptional regulator/sugar kinase [Clostridium tetanomorphum DSM 665]|nr:transcriptional regulator/sugar kinase [Clostridium tetanomorphum DSM 665]